MIHPTAIIAKNAQLGANVSVGAYSIIHDNVIVGDNTTIGSYCEIGISTPLSDGSPLVFAKDSLIRSHSVFYEGSQFGERLVTGHRVTVRELTKAGANLQIGTLSDIQGHCEIGDYVRTHSNVHIGQKSKIGNFVWIFPYVVLTNDPHPPSHVLKGCEIADFAVIATMSVLLPGVKVGEHSLVAAHSMVSRDVMPHTVVGGSPAKKLCDTNQIKLQDGTATPAYPWQRHFQRGYPQEVTTMWSDMFKTMPEA
jgi:acyl-[acyl carrier protein]--UDP-N-acetylglucosamine O-acyltransferase